MHIYLIERRRTVKGRKNEVVDWLANTGFQGSWSPLITHARIYGDKQEARGMYNALASGASAVGSGDRYAVIKFSSI